MNKLSNKKTLLQKKLKIIRVTTKPEALQVLLKGQLKFINNFHNVIGLSSPGKELRNVKIKEGIRIIPLEMTRKITPLKDMLSLIEMIRIFKREKPDIVHSHTPKAGIVSMIASVICSVPNRLHTVAGLPLMEKSGLKKQLLLFVEWLTYKCASKVYVNSNGLKKFILENISIPQKKISVIGFGSSNGIDTEFFTKNDKVNTSSLFFQKKFNLKNKFTFIFIGRIVKDKGIEELIKAFVKLNNKLNNTRLILLGRQEKDLDPITDETKNIMSLNKNIINLGYKSDIRTFLAASNCLVLPSYREGFPNVVLQAGSMKIPSIVTNINGCNEIIKRNINGLIVKPKSINSLYLAMKKISTDRKLYKSLKSSTRKSIISKFSKDKFFEKVLNIYSNLN